mgnify:CR=1 FL=1
MKKFIGMALAAVISASSFTALAAGAIPDHQGTSMDGIEIGTAQLNSAVKSYYDLFEQAGDQYGVAKGYIGSITIGGVEIKDIDEKTLMNNITAVNFNSYIFAGTVRENMLIADKSASDEKMIEALKMVNLWSFLSEQDGLDTKLNQQGSNFSGGQRQRLAIARALLHNTPIYVFDEVTSNIDAESENDIMTVIHNMAKIKTVILISHRLENVVGSDKILLLDKGKIEESGTHSELMSLNKKYKLMYSTQAELEKYAKEEA